MSFISTLPSKALHNPEKKSLKYQTLIKFAQGVNRCGDRGMISVSAQYEPCDVAVILGWVHDSSKSAPHLRLRREIYEEQKRRGNHVIIADSSLFLYRNPDNPHYYLRYSFDGVFPDTGQYCNDRPNVDRWRQIKEHIGLELRAWRNSGNHVLLCLQRDGGWSMGDFKVVDWVLETIRTVRESSNRPIVIRPHPGDRRARIYCDTILDRVRNKRLKNVTMSAPGRLLLEDLVDCWAVVNHNSSPAVAAAIEGIPVFVTDPQRSQAAAVSNLDFACMENPRLPDRDEWVHGLAQCHWSHEDLITGRCWQHMRNYIEPDSLDWTEDED
jgi:hypothetical protein